MSEQCSNAKILKGRRLRSPAQNYNNNNNMKPILILFVCFWANIFILSTTTPATVLFLPLQRATSKQRLQVCAGSLVSSERDYVTFAICYRNSVCRLCLSVVCNVGAPYSAGWNFQQFFSPHDSPGTLVFWCQKWLVGDAPFPLKFAFKVTHPFFKQQNFDQYRLIAPQPW